MNDTVGPLSGMGSPPKRVREPATATSTSMRRVRPRRRIRPLTVIAGLLAMVALAWLGYREWDPPTLREAASAYRRGDLEAAHRKATGHLSSRPMSRTAALIAARSLGRMGRAGEAEPYSQRAGRLGVDVEHDRAFALIQARLHSQAAEVYEEILSRSPGDVTALRRLAVARILQSRWNDALEVAGRLKQLPRGKVIGYTLAGVVYHDTARPDAAVVEFEHVVALDPDLLQMPLQPKQQFWVYLTQDLVGLGRGEDARPYLTRALADRQDPFYYDLLGESFWQEGAMEDAERSWLKSIELNPRRAQPWLSLGNLELQRNHPEAAVERLCRAAGLAPSAREPYYSLGQAYSRLGRGEEAARCRSIADRLASEILTPPRGMGESRSH
jgi:tetratricopeptide (TPR) repeat protein